MTKTLNERAEELFESIKGNWEPLRLFRSQVPAMIAEALREQARENARIASEQKNYKGQVLPGAGQAAKAILAQLQQGGGER